MTYKEKLLSPKWQKKRLEILNQNNFSCQYCGNKESTLHVHHLCYNINYNPWDVDDSALLCLCEKCHKVEHLKNLTPLEEEILSCIQTSAIIFSGHNQGINFIVNHINEIFLKHKNNG